MSFILQDLARPDNGVQINGWNWRPTLALIESFGIIDDERLEMMCYNGTGVTITRDEAQTLADKIEGTVLPKLGVGDRVLYDLSTTNEPDDGTFYRDEPERNYSASYEWLTTFVSFCRGCEGFTVL